MAFIHQRITIVKIRKPVTTDVNEELQFLGNSLGLFNLRDKDKSCFRVFIELLKAANVMIKISTFLLVAKVLTSEILAESYDRRTTISVP